MGMSADDRRPLEKNLISPIAFLFTHAIVRVGELQAQAIKLADVPGYKGRIANCLLSGTFNAWSVVKKKTRGPVLIELQLSITVSAVRLAAL